MQLSRYATGLRFEGVEKIAAITTTANGFLRGWRFCGVCGWAEELPGSLLQRRGKTALVCDACADDAAGARPEPPDCRPDPGSRVLAPAREGTVAYLACADCGALEPTESLYRTHCRECALDYSPAPEEAALGSRFM